MAKGLSPRRQRQGRQQDDRTYLPIVQHEIPSYWVDRVRYKEENGHHIYVRDQVYRGPENQEDQHTIGYGVLTGAETLLFGGLQDQRTSWTTSPERRLRIRRSDHRIFEDVCESLTWDPYIDASDITVDVQEGLVRLEGSVESRPMRRRAEEILEFIPGVKDIENRLQIQAKND